MPTARPAASKTAKGSIEPAARRSSRRAISARMPSGDGMLVYQSCHSSPSRVASQRAS